MGCTRGVFVPLDGLEVKTRQVVQGGGTHAGDGDVQGPETSLHAANNEGEGRALTPRYEAEVIVAEALQQDKVGLAHLGVGHDVCQGYAQSHL